MTNGRTDRHKTQHNGDIQQNVLYAFCDVRMVVVMLNVVAPTVVVLYSLFVLDNLGRL